MNWLSSRIVSLYIKWTLFTFFFFVNVSARAWEVDFSRRQRDIERMRKPASVAQEVVEPATPEKIKTEDPTFWKAVVPETFVDSVASASDEAQDVVIMHTDKGFVPDLISLRKGGKYRIHVVNISEKEKNVSFILDDFSEHHATYFGKDNTFDLRPKVGGVYQFLSPETARQGKIVILDDERKPASSK